MLDYNLITIRSMEFHCNCDLMEDKFLIVLRMKTQKKYRNNFTFTR